MFGTLPEYNAKETNQLLLKITEPGIIDKLIVNHMRLAFAIANQKKFIRPNFSMPERRAEALYALTVAVNNLIGKPLDDQFDFVKYASLTISGYLKKALYKNSLFWIDPQTFKKLEEKGIKFSPIILNNEIEKEYEPRDNTPSDLLKNVSLTDRELQILELKTQQFSGAAIGRKLGISRERVRQVVAKIGEKVLDAK